jgi:hypothetical protein
MSVLATDGGGRADHVFQAIIDLLIPGQTPGIKEHIVDLYEKPEILFFGPDEGTADMMDWAASKFLLWNTGSWHSRLHSPRSGTWCPVVEVLHHWQERGDAGRYPT